MGVVWCAAIDSPGYLCKAESQSCGSALLVVHHTRLSVLRSGREKAARNAPKSHYYRFYHAGVFAAVVAKPIQDMSAVSITDKTVGIRLPRLWCGAIG